MERRGITVFGLVQGVGFRPFVYRLASRLHLNGFVKNHSGSLLIEVQGDRAPLHEFVTQLQTQPPPLSRIDRVECRSLAVVAERDFRIEPSENMVASPIFISPDIATCDDCLSELFDSSDRRYRYAFINCTHCGPRLTIIQGVPYDRQQTTMSGFRMCPDCRSEYENPDDRRFHAQPIACPVCGPQLVLKGTTGDLISSRDPLVEFADAMLDGKIGALKGLGGFHLVCDATNADVVERLRRRKHREEKPFAIMAPDLAAAEEICQIEPLERELLGSSMAPIVLLNKRPLKAAELPLVAPNVTIGVPNVALMLPYTPLHHLLLNAVGGIPLVMTSGNRSDEPIAYRDEDCLAQLDGIADLILTHNRPIHVRCDDSVTRVVRGVELPIRRSRGYAPRSLPMPIACPYPIVAVGGQLKAVFALGRNEDAILSHHLGDLDHLSAYQAFVRDLELYEQLFELHPRLIAHDLHPDYMSTNLAVRMASEAGIGRLAIQHHHAHMASCMAENGLNEPVIGVTFDGTGYGFDQAIWGGEFLVGDYRQALRAAQLRYVRLPGGDAGIREPWRIGISYLRDADLRHIAVTGADDRLRMTIEHMIDRELNSPQTSSMGRLFDAVAAITGVCTHASFEGQAAMRLEELASEVHDTSKYPFALTTSKIRPLIVCPIDERNPVKPSDSNWKITPLTIDSRPIIRAIVQDLRQGRTAATVARRFHSTVVEIIVATCLRIRLESQLNSVVLSGGVFLNALLTSEAFDRLAAEGFQVYRHRHVPPNDGGLSLGQLAIAAAISQPERIGVQ